MAAPDAARIAPALSGEVSPSEATIDVVAGVAVRAGRVLLVEAKHGVAVPGGKVEAGQTHAEALADEIWQETGLRVRRVGRHLLVDVRPPYVVHLYAMEVDDREPVAGSDARRAWWGLPDELDAAARVGGVPRDTPLAYDVLRRGVAPPPLSAEGLCGLTVHRGVVETVTGPVPGGVRAPPGPARLLNRHEPLREDRRGAWVALRSGGTIDWGACRWMQQDLGCDPVSLRSASLAPARAVVGVARVDVDCYDRVDRPWYRGPVVDGFPNRAWMLADVVVLPEPIPCPATGPGFFRLDPAVARRVVDAALAVRPDIAR